MSYEKAKEAIESSLAAAKGLGYIDLYVYLPPSPLLLQTYIQMLITTGIM